MILPSPHRVHCAGRGRSGFSLVELLTVLTLVLMLCGLALAGMRSLQPSRLSQSGEMVGGVLSLAHSTAMARSGTTIVAFPVSGEAAYRSVAVFSRNLRTRQWEQLTPWRNTGEGIFFDADPSLANSLFSSPSASLPADFPSTLAIKGVSIPAAGARYLIFDALGMPSGASSDFLRVRLIPGFRDGTADAPVVTDQANHYDLLVLSSVSGIKHLRP